jgi:hypothetical protein
MLPYCLMASRQRHGTHCADFWSPAWWQAAHMVRVGRPRLQAWLVVSLEFEAKPKLGFALCMGGRLCQQMIYDCKV